MNKIKFLDFNDILNNILKKLIVIAFLAGGLQTTLLLKGQEELDETQASIMEIEDNDFFPFTEEEESILLPSEPPIDPATGKPVSTDLLLTLPLFGTLSLTEVNNPKTNKTELQGTISKSIQAGLISINSGTVRILDNNQILFDVKAQLLGKPITISLIEWKKAGPLNTQLQGSTKKVNLPIESAHFRAQFITNDQINSKDIDEDVSLEILPNKTLKLSHFDLIVSQAQGLEVKSIATVFNQKTILTFQINQNRQLITDFKLDKITLSQLASSLSNTPFKDVALSASFKVTGDIFKTQAETQRQLSATFSGEIDISSLRSSAPFFKTVNLKSVSASGSIDRDFLSFNAELGDLYIAPLGTIKNTTFEFNAPLKSPGNIKSTIATQPNTTKDNEEPEAGNELTTLSNENNLEEKEIKEDIKTEKTAAQDIIIEPEPEKIKPTTPLLKLTGIGTLKVLGKAIDYSLSSDYHAKTGFTLQGYLGTIVPSKNQTENVDTKPSDINYENLTEIVLPGGLKLNGAKFKINTSDQTALITGIHNIAGLELLLNLDINLKNDSKIDLNANIISKDYYPLKNIPNIDARLKNIKINNLKFLGGINYTKATGLIGNIELNGNTQLGQVLGKDEKTIQQTTSLQTLITALVKIKIGTQSDVVIDVALENLPSLKELFPDLFNNQSDTQKTTVTNEQGERIEETVAKDLNAQQGLLDFIDLFKLTQGHIVISSRSGIVIEEKTYDKGLSIKSKVSLDLSDQSNSIVQLVSKIIQMTGKNPATLELTGNINPANIRSTNLTVALGSGDLQASIGPKVAPATLKTGSFGLKFTGTPSVAITAGFTLTPRPGETPLEFATDIDFSVYKVGFTSSMKNIWAEPFGVKGFAFGNLGAQWYQDYATIATAIASLPAVFTGVGAAATAGAWANALLLPTDIGFAGSVTFVKGAARARILQELEAEITEELNTQLAQEINEKIELAQKNALRESIFTQKLYARECGTRAIHQGPGRSDDYICARVFFNIGKDISNLGLDVAIENPLTLVDLLDFIGQQMKVDTAALQNTLNKLVPFKIKQATLKFAPVGSKIGSITLDAGLGISGFIEVLGQESCFVASIDWAQGILLRGKMPKIVKPNITIAGAYCQGDLAHTITCTPEEFTKLQEQYKDLDATTLDIKTCERTDPGFELKVSLKELPRLIISCYISIGQIISGTTQINISIEGIDMLLDTKVMNSQTTVKALTTGKNIATQDLTADDLAIEVTIKNALREDSPEIVKYVTDLLENKINSYLEQQKEKLENKKWDLQSCKRLQELQQMLEK